MKQEPIILFRKGIAEQGEFEVAQKHFEVTQNRTACKDRLVIGRYSVLPFYRELEKDLIYNNCSLINSHNNHCWIADFGYYHELKQYTPKSWERDHFYSAPEGRYVVKGKTNSRKHQWKTHMFAETKQQAVEISHDLLQDGLLCDQGIIFREYVPLKQLGVNPINGQPYANEWRFFYYKTKMIAHGYYWSSAPEEVISSAKMDSKGFMFAFNLALIASEYVDFFVLDIAEKEEGSSWILIEMNDAQMSGLSECSADELYSNLNLALRSDE